MDTSRTELVAKIRQKFEALETTCMARYDAREEHIISTLQYCTSVLEQLHSWAVFGIFPTDEDEADKYIGFVQQRFQCVIDPLRVIMKVSQEVDGNTEQTSKPRKSKGLGAGEPRVSPGKLRDRVDSMATQYLQEGRHVHKATMMIIHKCRKDVRIIYRWGQASLMDLHDILDEPLAEELYFMVRGKMARVLSIIGLFEEAAKAMEKSFSEVTTKTCLEQKTPANTNTGSSLGDSKNSSLSSNSDMLYVLKELEDSESGFATKPDGDDLESADSNTPEPPTSPRPKGLLNHPKILKDQMLTHSMSSKLSPSRAPLDSTW